MSDNNKNENQVLDTVASKDRFVPANYLQNFTIDQLNADAKSALPGNQSAVAGKSNSSIKKCVVKTDPIPLPKYSNSASKQLTLQVYFHVTHFSFPPPLMFFFGDGGLK